MAPLGSQVNLIPPSPPPATQRSFSRRRLTMLVSARGEWGDWRARGRPALAGFVSRALKWAAHREISADVTCTCTCLWREQILSFARNTCFIFQSCGFREPRNSRSTSQLASRSKFRFDELAASDRCRCDRSRAVMTMLLFVLQRLLICPVFISEFMMRFC
jgi:hypothetical protein